MNDNNFRTPFEGKRSVSNSESKAGLAWICRIAKKRLMELQNLKFISSIWPEGLSLLSMKAGVMHLPIIVLLLSACIKGYDDEWTFSSGVEGVTLESPKAEDVTFTPSADGSTVKVVWPVVYGAGGYQFSLYIVDDPLNPVLVGVENEFIDGCSATRSLLEDTRYKVVLKSLGNEKSNNKEASSATEISYSTLLAATIIPDGTDLAQYFSNNPVVDSGTEIAYELEGGGTYTMSGEVNFGTANVTFRGNKVNRPMVTLSAGFKSQGGGTKFKFINFDCTNIPVDATFYGFNSIPEGSTLVNNAVLIANPIVFQSCNFNALPVPLYWDNGKNYVPYTLLIKDCVAEMTNNGRVIRNSASNGGIKDFTAINSTFYKNNTGTDYWMQLSGARLENFGFATGGQTYSNCTFYGFDRMHNSNNYSRPGIYVTIEKCIFLEMLRDQTARYILPSNNVNNKILTYDNNTYWRLGAAENYGSYDKSGTALDEDPLCANPAVGDFTVGNPNTISRGIGDPRWLSVQ